MTFYVYLFDFRICFVFDILFSLISYYLAAESAGPEQTTPRPIPAKPPIGIWTAKDDQNNTSMKMQFGVRFKIPFLNTSNQVRSGCWSFNVTNGRPKGLLLNYPWAG